MPYLPTRGVVASWWFVAVSLSKDDSDDGEGGSGGKIKLDESTRRTWSMKSRDEEIDAEK